MSSRCLGKERKGLSCVYFLLHWMFLFTYLFYFGVPLIFQAILDNESGKALCLELKD